MKRVFDFIIASLLLMLLLPVLFILTVLMNKFLLIGILLGIGVLTAVLFRRQRATVMALVIAFLVSSGFIFGVNYAFQNILKPYL